MIENRSKRWDGMINRELYGPKWAQRKDELVWYFAFLEKPASNPHWHLLLRFVGRWAEDLAEEDRRFPAIADAAWLRIMPSGTVDVRSIQTHSGRRLEDYVAKELSHSIQYQSFITPDELRPK